MQTTILAQRNSHNKIKYHNFYLNGDTFSREHGTLGGVDPKETSNTFGYTNKGKKNELSPAETAEKAYLKQIDTKVREGYVVIDTLENAQSLVPPLGVISFQMNNIPLSLCCSKPTASIALEDLKKFVDANQFRFFIKHNGLCHYIVIDADREVKIYTRRWHDHTRKYPAIVECVKAKNYPVNSMLITEFLVDPELDLPHMKAYKLMESISKANVSGDTVKEDLTKTMDRQKKHRVRACVFGVCYWDGQETWSMPYYAQIGLINGEFKPLSSGETLFTPTEIRFKTAEAVVEWAKVNRKKYEGLVGWVMAEAMVMTLNGKPKRRAAYKIKDPIEMDVIAYDYLEGTGKLQGKIGSLYIGLRNAAGKFVEMGKTGSGLKPKEGDNEIDAWDFPCVIEATFDQVFPTGKLQNPRITKKHAEKVPEECITFEEHMERAA